MRLLLAPGALAFALLDAIASLALCCSASVARAEGAASAPQTRRGDEYERIKDPGPITDDQTRADLGYELGSVPLSFPRRGPLIGDFWTADELKRHFGGR